MHLGWELGGWLWAWGAQGEPRTGGKPQRCTPAALGRLGAVARGSFKDFISWDFKALKLKVLRLEGLKIENLIFELKAEGSKDRRI